MQLQTNHPKTNQGGQLAPSALKRFADCSALGGGVQVLAHWPLLPHSVQSTLLSGPTTRKNMLPIERGTRVRYSPVSGSISTGVSMLCQSVGPPSAPAPCNWPAPS